MVVFWGGELTKSWAKRQRFLEVLWKLIIIVVSHHVLQIGRAHV